ncbi:MAG: rhodanese-like domain-containing protein, partial [Bacteroidota bacterium]|nr:rhodanese-like domain-containing protein [Bacteroidota bacterium]
MLFIGGALLGVLAFAEGYPLFEGLYKAGFAGSPRIFDTLGIPKSLFAFLLTAVALVAYWAVSMIEDRVNGRKPVLVNINRTTVIIAIVGLLIALSGFLFPSRKETLLGLASRQDIVKSYPVRTMSVDELAFRLIDNDTRIRIIDFRPMKEFERFHLPRSVSLTVDNLFEKEPSRILRVKNQRNIFVAANEEEARKIAVIAMESGHRNVWILEGGLKGFEENILRFQPPPTPYPRNVADTYRFRTYAASVLPKLIEADRSSGAVKKTIKRTLGGC